MRDLINIPKGNAFNLHVCPQRIAPKQENASFNDITDFAVSVTRQGYETISVPFTRTEDGDLIAHCPAYKLGDANNDGEVTITDAAKVVELAAQGSTDQKADVNSDDKVTTADANAIAEHVLGTQKL